MTRVSIEHELPDQLSRTGSSQDSFRRALRTEMRPVLENGLAQIKGGQIPERISSTYTAVDVDTAEGLEMGYESSDPLALFREAGTKPHVIRARNAPWLIFEVGGHIVKVKEVDHPGTEPKREVEAVWREVRPQLDEAGARGFYRWARNYGEEE